MGSEVHPDMGFWREGVRGGLGFASFAAFLATSPCVFFELREGFLQVSRGGAGGGEGVAFFLRFP